MAKGKYFNSLMEKLKVDCFGAAETNLQWNVARTPPIKTFNLKKGSKNNLYVQQK